MVKTRNQPIDISVKSKIVAKKSHNLRRRLRKQHIQIPSINSIEEKQAPRKETILPEPKQKPQSSNQDIDMYFASCIQSTPFHKQDHPQWLEKNCPNITQRNKRKPSEVSEIKMEYIEEEGQSQVSSVQNILEQDGQENQNEVNQSPIFGRKIMKRPSTPPHKLEQLKVYDQSEEVVRKDLMDQLEEASKISLPSENHSVSHQMQQQNHVRSIDERMNREKKYCSSKKKTSSTNRLFEEEEREFSFKRAGHNEQLKRRAQILKIAVLSQTNQSLQKSLRFLKRMQHSLKSVMYYYEVRQMDEKLYAYRSSVFSVISEEIKKLSHNLGTKKNVCSLTMKQKMKNKNHGYLFWQQRMDSEQVGSQME